MPQVKFIEFDGTKHNIDANNGDSIMTTAISNLVPGIDADCGGECSCATC
ncbi:MAG: 2Fe-2S ferredoxin, partial [Gammaproteobacteria bacterium]|nr:2Fe-2S ferredoxin [Gammaproteobacteria bacterium]